jgi:hypothetical protein
MDNNQTDEKNIVDDDDVNGNICKSITSKMTINVEENNNLKRKRVKPVQQEPKKRVKREPKKRVKQESKKQEPKRIRTKKQKPTANTKNIPNLVERNYDALTVTEKLNCIAYCVQNLFANKI